MERDYITVTRIEEYLGMEYFRPGMELFLKKDHDNPYDDEAIAVYASNHCKCGYVANSVCSVCRGTHSAGYVQHLIGEESSCMVRFASDSFLIAELNSEQSDLTVPLGNDPIIEKRRVNE